MIKIGIVGFGRMGLRHFAKYNAIAGADVVAIADVDGEKAARYGTDLQCFTSARAMMDAGLVDVVDVCTPAGLHAGVAIAALQAGVHVIVEKPIAMSVRDARAMVAAAGKAGRLLFVAHVVRYWPEYARLQEFIRSRCYGRLLSLFMSRFRSVPGWKRSGVYSSCVDLLIHDLDYVCHVIGTPADVAITTKIDDKGTAEITGMQALIGGTYITWDVVKRAGPDMFWSSFQAEFEGASVVYNSEARNGRLKVLQIGQLYLERFSDWYDPYEAELTDFIKTIQDGAGYAGNGPGAAVAALGILEQKHRLGGYGVRE